jgi:hypothetical protein
MLPGCGKKLNLGSVITTRAAFALLHSGEPFVRLISLALVSTRVRGNHSYDSRVFIPTESKCSNMTWNRSALMIRRVGLVMHCCRDSNRLFSLCRLSSLLSFSFMHTCVYVGCVTSAPQCIHILALDISTSATISA